VTLICFSVKPKLLVWEALDIDPSSDVVADADEECNMGFFSSIKSRHDSNLFIFQEL